MRRPMDRQPTGFGDLPQELVDLVIDHFHDDPTTLRICALVSRRWQQAARTHIFRETLLRHPQDVYACYNLIEYSPQFATCIRTLRISAKLFKPRDNGTHHLKCGFMETIQQSIFHSLPQLRTLHFEDVIFTAESVDAHFLGSLARLPINELKFTKCDFGSFEIFETVLYANSNITRLALDDVRWKMTPDRKSFPTIHRARRAKLKLTHVIFGRYCELDLYSNWLSQTSTFPSLRSLEAIGLTQLRDVQLIADMLRRVALTLTHLRLACSFSCRYEGQLALIPQTIDLRQLHQLYSLHLSPQGLTNHLFSWAPGLLDQAISPHLRKITVDAHLQFNQRELKLREWQNLIALIKAPRFAYLEQICIWHRGPLRLYEAEALMKDYLTGLREHQKVRVEDHTYRG